MTPRSMRRAQKRREVRKARKQAREQQAAQTEIEISTEQPCAPMSQATVSEARLEANRANAQLSTGPTSAEGKAKVSLNAIKTGLTGRTVLLPGEDLDAYNATAARLRNAFNPVGEEEEALVQSLIDTHWRLNRIPELEAAVYAAAMHRVAAQFADVEDEPTRLSLMRGEAHLLHFRQLGNLCIQEGRLLRRRDKDTAALVELQRQRREQELKASSVAAAPKPSTHSLAMSAAAGPTNSTGLGFEFSNALAPAPTRDWEAERLRIRNLPEEPASIDIACGLSSLVQVGATSIVRICDR